MTNTNARQIRFVLNGRPVTAFVESHVDLVELHDSVRKLAS